MERKIDYKYHTKELELNIRLKNKIDKQMSYSGKFKLVYGWIKSDHIRIESGVWWRRIKTIPFRMITDIKAMQGPLMRVFNLGNLNIQTAGMGAQNVAEGVLRGLFDYKEKQTEILKRVREYSPKGEIKTKVEEPMKSEEKLLKEMLHELKEIRNKIK